MIAAYAQVDSLKVLIRLKRLALITELEEIVNEVDVRKDLNKFLEDTTQLPNRNSNLDDKNVLNSHSEDIGIGVGIAGRQNYHHLRRRSF